MQPRRSERGKKNQPEKALNHWCVIRKKLKAVTHSGTLTLVLQILLRSDVSSHRVYNHENVTMHVEDFQCCCINNFTLVGKKHQVLLQFSFSKPVKNC